MAPMRARYRTRIPAWLGPAALTLGLAWLLLAAAGPAAAQGYQGFGASTPGGAGGPIVRVTTLADSGPGSLREAVAAGHRTVVFDVGGDIVLQDYLYVRGAFVTIDGSTAPPPGITLRNRGLIIRGSRGAHDVIVRGIRVRASAIDGIQVAYGAYNVVIDHVSIAGSGDGNLDITEDSHDVTVSWSLLAAPASGKTMLIKYNPSRVTLHHNLFVNANGRNPNVSIDNAGTPAADTTLDMRNNVVANWSSGWGTLVHYGSTANVVANYYTSPASTVSKQRQAIIVCATPCQGDPASVGFAHVAGNVSADAAAANLNAAGNVAVPFAAPLVDVEDACTAAQRVLAEAGVRPFDALDAQHVASVAPPACVPGGTP